MNILKKTMCFICLILLFMTKTTSSEIKHISEVSKKKVNINTQKNKIKTNKYTSKEILLARLIMSEGVGESFETKIAIGNAVLNRHKQYSKNYGNLRKIIYSRGQFSGISGRYFKMYPNEEALKASRMVYQGVNNVGKSTHFLNISLCKHKPSWVKKFKFVKKIGNMSFYYNPNF